MAEIIDGKKISQEIKDELKEKVAVVLVGQDPASCVYVRNKKRACEYIGIRSLSYELAEDTSEEEVLALIDKLNGDKDVNGILVQLPLPKHMDEDKITRAIDPLKDVDGFHPQNVGALSIGLPGFVSCTPAGIIQLLKRSHIDMEGKHCVALLMLRENATVTVTHSKTKDLASVTRQADILIVAIGKKQFITADYVKEGVVVIDVGMHRDENNHLCGDVAYDEVASHCSAITPVPGGVGPMTIAMLMHNCLESVELQK